MNQNATKYRVITITIEEINHYHHPRSLAAESCHRQMALWAARARVSTWASPLGWAATRTRAGRTPAPARRNPRPTEMYIILIDDKP